MEISSHRNNTPLLLLLDGILSQDEQSTSTALKQIQKIDPDFRYLQSVQTNFPTSPSANLEYEAPPPLRSASAPVLFSSALEGVVERLEGVVERLLTIQPHLAQVPSESDGSLPLHFAASIGNIRVAALLLDFHRDAALAHNAKGKIPLHYAAREGRIEMVRFLLRIVPQCAAILTKKGKLALHFAAAEGHTEVVRDLLRVYPSGATLPSKKGKIALHFAARWGHIDIARHLCQIYPACINTLDYDGSNPLHDATREGQFEMTKFLVERYPPVMYKSNIRGEIPLFAAIRSGDITLCAFLIRSWPESGKQVLQTISDPDDVSRLEPAILNLCLRGAVGNFTNLSPEERGYIDDHSRNIIDKITNTNAVIILQGTPNQELSDECVHDTNHQCKEVALESDKCSTPQRPPSELDNSMPRSKSPILESDECGKKRSASGTNTNKRQRFGSIHGDREVSEVASAYFPHRSSLENHTFYQLHAALECSATTNVLKCVLERYPEQRSVQDDYGRLPLHIAISHYRSKGSVDFTLDQIWKPHQDACSHRDYLGRLPLHSALMTRADSRIVKVLLDAYPTSGVEQCQVVDEKFSRMLPIHMASAHGCDLSTLFMLIRRDPTVVEAWKL